MIKTDIEALELYQSALKKELEKAEAKHRKLVEKEKDKLKKFFDEYPTRRSVDEAYECDCINLTQRDKLMEKFDNLEKFENKETGLSKYIYLLKKRIASLSVEIKGATDEEIEVIKPIEAEEETELKGLPLGDKYRFTSDSLGITLQEKRFVKDKGPVWFNVSYHPSLKMGLKWLVQKEINGTGLKDIQTISDRIEKLNEYINSEIKVDNLIIRKKGEE